jgi:hypothetical protein
LIITFVFEKNAKFFAENCRKSQKIVIAASTPDLTVSNFRHVSKDGVLHSHRIIISDWALAPWVQRLIGANRECLAHEYSTVDPK